MQIRCIINHKHLFFYFWIFFKLFVFFQAALFDIKISDPLKANKKRHNNPITKVIIFGMFFFFSPHKMCSVVCQSSPNKKSVSVAKPMLTQLFSTRITHKMCGVVRPSPLNHNKYQVSRKINDDTTLQPQNFLWADCLWKKRELFKLAFL